MTRTVRNDVAIVSATAIQRGQCPLQEGDGYRWAHVDPGVEQFGGDCRSLFGNGIKARPQPVDAAVDRPGLRFRQVPDCATIPMRARDRLGDSEAGWPALVRRVVDVPALAIEQLVEHPIDVQS